VSFEVNYEEDLVPRIRDLIDGYSKNSILKEYLQNADDSGATELVVTFDKRIHTSLIGTKFEFAKEASLILYNNACFKDKDFEAIVKISAQGKIDDAHSTGRFGQGFSSSFSISDHPSFVSSGRAYWFDVLKNAVAKERDKGIQGWSLESDIKEISQWLKTFDINNERPGTIFRLPLRNEATANISDISHEVFRYDDFLSWCDEWKDNTSGLLFLRHIQKLVLREINENNEKIVHVEICTKNSKEIHEYNNKIQDEFSSSLLSICKNWKNTRDTLPFFTYKHHFLIKHFDRVKNIYHDYEESWAVINGLFRGEEDSLIDQAIKVLNIRPNPRKVLPWAGVAISLDKKGWVKKQRKSSYHTFLPLPIKSKHPIHIHGWFDLNPKRTEITCDGSGDDKNILIEWNQLLFKEGVGTAWAYLVDFIKERCSPQIYYSLWPKSHDDEFDKYLLEGFYNKINEFECFKTKHKDEKSRWNRPKDNIYLFQDNSNKKIFEAFKEHFSIITPKPTQNVITGLSLVGTVLSEITPEFIRAYLKEESDDLDLPLVLDDMPIAMLAKKEWLLSILVFCAEADEDKDFSSLVDLPLELTLDNKVNFLSENKLLDSNPKLSVFMNDKSLFIQSEIIEIVKDAEVLPPSWMMPSLKNYLTILNEHIFKYDRKNKRWLKSFLGMIINSDETNVSEVVDQIHGLRVVYQYGGTFGKIKSEVGSPVLILKEEINNIDYLAQAGMKLVHPEYVDIYRLLLKWNKYEFITELNSLSLIKHLVSMSEDEYEFFKEKNTREYLVDLLSQDDSWIKDLNDNEIMILNEIPFIATESGNVYAKSEVSNLYLSSGFNPPKHIQNLNGEYEIISAVDEKQHAMYIKMGFDEQNPINYLEHIILPFISNLPSVDDTKTILEWLSNNWEDLTKDIDESKKEELIATLSDSQIVLDTECNVNLARNYYHPDFYSELPISLKNKNYLPFKFEDSTTQRNWRNLLGKLGASKEIIPEHIVTTIHSIVEDENESKAIGILNYISNHFEWFDEMKYINEDIFEYLSVFAWIPADKTRNKFLVPEYEYKKLRKPCELILKNDYKIAGGAHYVISFKINLGKKDEDGEYSEKYIAKKLGLLVKPSNESVFNSFRRLQGVNSQHLNNEIKLLDYSKIFYKYIGRSYLCNNDIPMDIKEKPIFVRGNWLPASKVFQKSINLSGIYNWGELLINDGGDSKLAEGLIKLGVLNKPGNEYLINYLCNLPQGKRLNKYQLKDATAILKQLQDNLEEIDVEGIDISGVPILSLSNKLIVSGELYVNDLPAYNNSNKKNEKLEFCQQRFKDISNKSGVSSLAGEIKSSIDYDNSKQSKETNSSWNDYIRCKSFKSAVLRLIYHEGKLGDYEIKQESIDDVLPSELLLMDVLVVSYFIDGTWIYDDSRTSAYQDIEKSTLHILNLDDDEDMCESIATFISDSSHLSRGGFSLINRILRHKIDSIEEIDSLLDKKNIKSLPGDLEIDDGFSLYSGVADESEVDDDSPLNNNPFYEQGSSNEMHSSIEDDTQSNSTTFSGRKNNTQSSADILRPIKLKKSNHSDMKHEASSFGDHNMHDYNMQQGRQKENSANNVDVLNSSGIKIDSSKIVSPNNRRPVYVGVEREIDPDEQRNQKLLATEIGDRGEYYVLEHSINYLLSRSNNFEKAPTNNKGYDILEKDSSGEIVRYIEVKTLTGDWGEGGVSVTESQFEFAQVYDNWWLFVVENINTQNTCVHTFENPVQQVNRFMFDCSWKRISETSSIKDQ